MRLFLFLVFLILPAPSFAQENENPNVNPRAQLSVEERRALSGRNQFDLRRQSFTVKPRYEFLTRQALDQPSHFDFSQLRYLYSQMPDYDPESSQTMMQILTLQERIIAGDQEAQAAYTKIVMAHLGNLDIVNQAYVLSLDHQGFGNSEFFKWLRTGMLQSLLRSGTGQSLARAYAVITLAEEAALLRELDVDVKQTLNRQSGIFYYNIHDVSDRKTGQEYSIFVNTTAPMEVLEARAREAINDIQKR